jgi:pilus assembly protein Flp/PilA
MLLARLRQIVPALQCPFCGVWRDRRAVTSLEYGLIAVIIIIAIVGGLHIIGGELAHSFNTVSSEL